MTRRWRNLTADTGFVGAVPFATNNEDGESPAPPVSEDAFTLFYGVSDVATPTDALITAMTEVEVALDAASWTFPNANGDYLYFAVPTSVQSNNLLDISGFATNFTKYTINLTVDGSSVEYEVGRSTYLQYGDSITASIIVQ